MEDCCDQWHDPLLATDASWQRESFSHCEIFSIFSYRIEDCFCFQPSLLTFCDLFISSAAEKATVSSSGTIKMADLDSNSELSNGKSFEI